MIQEFAPGDTFEYSALRRYSIQEVVYSAETGRTLYKVRSADDGLLYALKVFDTSMNDIATVKNEMVALNNQNQQPHLLPRFRGFHQEGKIAYLVMDWMEGTTFQTVTLGNSITSSQDFNFRRIMLLSLCDTVSLLHNQRYWHRDLKPENVMLRDKRMPKEGVIVVDLGQAAQSRGDCEGTYGYCAPEQYGRRCYSIGPWTDVFSVAQIAWFLLTGEPLELSTALEGEKWSRDHSGSLAAALPSVALPPSLEGILLKAMAYQPKMRFPKIIDLKTALSRLP